MKEAIKKIEEETKRIEEQNMQVELHLAYNINKHNITIDSLELKMKIKRYALEREICLRYAFGAIVILVMVLGLFGGMN
jgi:hypothetical protein